MPQTKSNEEKHGEPRTRILVVLCLAIILLLGSLALSAFLFPRDPEKIELENEVKTRKEIRELDEAINNFEVKFSMDYIPSRIRLLDNGEYDPNNQLDVDSYMYLKRVWPRLSFPLDWNNNGKEDDVTLEGDQCLVFFLGGIQSDKERKLECGGFSTNPSNPAREGGDRVGPFFDFKPSRLVARSNGYAVYLDAYGKTPFAYFSGYKVRNGYNRYRTTDCKAIPDGPYCHGDDYYNRDSFQIISAGADAKFGRGGQWTPANAKDIDTDGRDDMSNFHPTLLGKQK